MIYIGLVSVFLAMLFKAKYRYFFNPATIFLFLWGGIFVLYSLRLYGLYDISESTVGIYLIGIIGFSMGNISIIRRKEVYLKDITNSRFDFSNSIRKTLIVFSIISIIVFLIYAVQMVPYWMVGGVSAVKQANAEGYIKVGNWIGILYTYFASPIQFIASMLVVVDILFNKRISLIFIALSTIMLILKWLCTGSKFALIVPVIAVVISMSFKKALIKSETTRRIKQLSPVKKFLLATVITIIIGFLISRLSSQTRSWFEQLYYYITGCIPCSENAFTVLSESNKFYYGVTSFNGFLRIIDSFMGFFGLHTPWNGIMNESYRSMLAFEKPIMIANGVRYNAFISCFCYFYSDGGILGVAILSFLFGKLSKISYEKLVINQDLYSFINYIVCCYMMITSMVRFQLHVITIPLAYLYIRVLLKKRRRKIRVSVGTRYNNCDLG